MLHDESVLEASTGAPDHLQRPAALTPLPPVIPDYLRDTYTWAYLTPGIAEIFDHQSVVEMILWGNAKGLTNRVLAEMEPGWRVLQPAAVYGTFSRRLAAALGPQGGLTVGDIAPLQVERTRTKLADMPQAQVQLRDATVPSDGPFDAVACFFLLHEVPDDVKAKVVAASLDAVRPGGKVIFTDYHRPHILHPLRPVAGLVFALLEPFARVLWRHPISEYAGARAADFTWRKQTPFGGLFQVVVATRKV